MILINLQVLILMLAIIWLIIIKEDVASSHGPNVLGNIGGFAGMFKLDKDYENPVLVACTDGVGTKVALAQEAKNLS